MNREKFFIITIDKEGIMSSFNSKEFHKNLIETKGVKAWWHYLESTYIIKVDYIVNANHVAKLIQKIAPNKKFFTSEIKFNDFNGWLPNEAWDWIRDNTKHNSS